ncbi:phthiocerol/phthiodiolone dimycocerosyl transferase family protein [Anabaena lutea]|uniref:Phthiocerol/phthiodiolone dimycocerosyl transferase n=1 Tax=Anabaena lutea FACHB-196 TaxID=2692881 RepID=A0ABR8FLF5_9NOST|nr:condensation domain-containing protein [Anabaena lutea]MBD2569650.1 alcohol acetyltransferase [Anabaena lutea FACHB-196]
MSSDRKLGNVEQAMEILNRRAKTWNLVTISRIKGDFQAAVLRQSLDIVQYRHPRLNSHILHFRKCFYFQTAGTEKIGLRIVNHINEEHWQEVVNEEMNQEIDSSKSLMRVVLVHILNEQKISYLITTLHHAISDGLSSIQLHSEILNYYQRLTSSEPIQPVKRLEPLQPIETLIPKSKQGFIGKISGFLCFLKLGFYKIWNQPQTLGFEKYVSISQRHSAIIHRQIDRELTQKFVQRCRQENTTVHSALSAILMFAVARKILKNHQKDVRVNCLSYLDLRKRLQPKVNEENLAVLATSMMGFHRIKPNTSFWDLAREVKHNLEAGIKRQDIFNMILIAKQLIDFSLIFPKQIAATVSVSNIGKVNIPAAYGELELEEISFAASHSLYAGVLVIHVATFQGKMLLNFVFSQPSISQKTMESLVTNVINLISDVTFNSLQLRGT